LPSGGTVAVGTELVFVAGVPKKKLKLVAVMLKVGDAIASLAVVARSVAVGLGLRVTPGLGVGLGLRVPVGLGAFVLVSVTRSRSYASSVVTTFERANDLSAANATTAPTKIMQPKIKGMTKRLGFFLFGFS